MTATDWIVDIVLIGLIVLQLRERPISIVQILLPIAIIAWALLTYVHTIPTTGNAIAFISAAIVVGALIGAGVGMLTRQRAVDGRVLVRASAGAAVLWVVGMGSRLVFQLWAENGGGVHLAAFDARHALPATAWAPALILMAAATILVRTGVILGRARLLATRTRSNSVA